uniref:Putative secreted protein n=1 Tax=Anopheles darlingi TaxID=43151 RepID=A0A2M4DMA7_ANODA
MWRGVVSRTPRPSTRCCAILAECLCRALAVRFRPLPYRPVKRRKVNRCSLGALTMRARLRWARCNRRTVSATSRTVARSSHSLSTKSLLVPRLQSSRASDL